MRKKKNLESMWSSLPVLILWMIKDKLDIFDNGRLAAVCRDWRSASLSYPKPLTSVGDGVPWIWRLVGLDFSNTRREFISSLAQRRFVIDMPEFADARLVSSKQGWVLLNRLRLSLNSTNSGTTGYSLLVLVNVFTAVKIQLPDLPLEERYEGSFTTRDGVPHRVFLLIKGDSTTVTIKTALAGDQSWTCHIYSEVTPKPLGMLNLIGIGMSLYFQDSSSRSRVIVFDVANQSCKQLQTPGRYGFIAEHHGALIYFDRQFSQNSVEDGDIRYDYSSSVVYRHNEAVPGSWERLEMAAVMDTNWFLRAGDHDCISAKGNGVKVYDIIQKERWKGKRSRTFVIVNDLLAGTAEANRLPVASLYPLRWVSIG